jgi:hypothetical protein
LYQFRNKAVICLLPGGFILAFQDKSRKDLQGILLGTQGSFVSRAYPYTLGLKAG